MDKLKIVENIQRICKERGTNPTVAGRESGAGETMVTNLKRKGTLPSIEKMQLLARYLGVTTSELLGEEKPTPVSGDGQGNPVRRSILNKIDGMSDSELVALDEVIDTLKKLRQ